MFVKQQVLGLLPPILHAVDYWINVKVFAPSCLTIPIGLKVGCTPILDPL